MALPVKPETVDCKFFRQPVLRHLGMGSEYVLYPLYIAFFGASCPGNVQSERVQCLILPFLAATGLRLPTLRLKRDGIHLAQITLEPIFPIRSGTNG